MHFQALEKCLYRPDDIEIFSGQLATYLAYYEYFCAVTATVERGRTRLRAILANPEHKIYICCQ
jgi:hypothetical protein